MTTPFVYGGRELDLFAQARNWKTYIRRLFWPHIHGDVLEVGAGIGTTTLLLHDGNARSWTCLEPDAALSERLRAAVGSKVEIITATLASTPTDQAFDTILYVDVLEHIENDEAEFARAASHLRVGGAIVVLAPAHPRLYSPFDRAIGHHRRYTKRMLRGISGGVNSVRIEQLRYVDSFGLLASLANRYLLHSAMPTPRQIQTWDRGLVPLSRLADPLLLYLLGKSILGVWRRPASAGS
jgi:SAM-dependent methyltransferase